MLVTYNFESSRIVRYKSLQQSAAEIILNFEFLGGSIPIIRQLLENTSFCSAEKMEEEARYS